MEHRVNEHRMAPTFPFENTFNKAPLIEAYTQKVKECERWLASNQTKNMRWKNDFSRMEIKPDASQESTLKMESRMTDTSEILNGTKVNDVWLTEMPLRNMLRGSVYDYTGINNAANDDEKDTHQEYEDKQGDLAEKANYNPLIALLFKNTTDLTRKYRDEHTDDNTRPSVKKPRIDTGNLIVHTEEQQMVVLHQSTHNNRVLMEAWSALPYNYQLQFDITDIMEKGIEHVIFQKVLNNSTGYTLDQKNISAYYHKIDTLYDLLSSYELTDENMLMKTDEGTTIKPIHDMPCHGMFIVRSGTEYCVEKVTPTGFIIATHKDRDIYTVTSFSVHSSYMDAYAPNEYLETRLETLAEDDQPAFVRTYLSYMFVDHPNCTEFVSDHGVVSIEDDIKSQSFSYKSYYNAHHLHSVWNECTAFLDWCSKNENGEYDNNDNRFTKFFGNSSSNKYTVYDTFFYTFMCHMGFFNNGIFQWIRASTLIKDTNTLDDEKNVYDALNTYYKDIKQNDHEDYVSLIIFVCNLLRCPIDSQKATNDELIHVETELLYLTTIIINLLTDPSLVLNETEQDVITDALHMFGSLYMVSFAKDQHSSSQRPSQYVIPYDKLIINQQTDAQSLTEQFMTRLAWLLCYNYTETKMPITWTSFSIKNKIIPVAWDWQQVMYEINENILLVLSKTEDENPADDTIVEKFIMYMNYAPYKADKGKVTENTAILLHLKQQLSFVKKAPEEKMFTVTKEQKVQSMEDCYSLVLKWISTQYKNIQSIPSSLLATHNITALPPIAVVPNYRDLLPTENTTYTLQRINDILKDDVYECIFEDDTLVVTPEDVVIVRDSKKEMYPYTGGIKAPAIYKADDENKVSDSALEEGVKLLLRLQAKFNKTKNRWWFLLGDDHVYLYTTPVIKRIKHPDGRIVYEEQKDYNYDGNVAVANITDDQHKRITAIVNETVPEKDHPGRCFYLWHRTVPLDTYNEHELTISNQNDFDNKVEFISMKDQDDDSIYPDMLVYTNAHGNYVSTPFENVVFKYPNKKLKYVEQFLDDNEKDSDNRIASKITDYKHNPIRIPMTLCETPNKTIKERLDAIIEDHKELEREKNQKITIPINANNQNTKLSAFVKNVAKTLEQDESDDLVWAPLDVLLHIGMQWIQNHNSEPFSRTRYITDMENMFGVLEPSKDSADELSEEVRQSLKREWKIYNAWIKQLLTSLNFFVEWEVLSKTTTNVVINGNPKTITKYTPQQENQSNKYIIRQYKQDPSGVYPRISRDGMGNMKVFPIQLDELEVSPERASFRVYNYLTKQLMLPSEIINTVEILFQKDISNTVIIFGIDITIHNLDVPSRKKELEDKDSDDEDNDDEDKEDDGKKDDTTMEDELSDDEFDESEFNNSVVPMDTSDDINLPEVVSVPNYNPPKLKKNVKGYTGESYNVKITERKNGKVARIKFSDTKLKKAFEDIVNHTKTVNGIKATLIHS